MLYCSTSADLVLDLCDGLGSIPAKGSSSMIILGSVISDRAISSRRRSPPETRLALVLRIVVRPNWSSKSFCRSFLCLRVR